MGPTRKTELSNEITSDANPGHDRFHALPCGVHESDVHGIITASNPGHHRILGYSNGELIGISVWYFLDSETEKDELRSYISHVLEHQPPPTPYVSKVRQKDGELIDVQVDWTYRRNDSGRVVGFLCVVIDVTALVRAAARTVELEAVNERLLREVVQREKMELLLAKRERELQHITGNVPAMISYVDADERYRFVNKNYEQLLGRHKSEIIGKNRSGSDR